MSVRATVLYDAPGPKGRRNNAIYTVITAIVATAVLAWVFMKLNERNQLSPEYGLTATNNDALNAVSPLA